MYIEYSLLVYISFIYVNKRKRERGGEEAEVRFVCSLVTRFAAKFADWLLASNRGVVFGYILS